MSYPAVASTAPIAVVRVHDPYRAFLALIDRFHPPAPSLAPGVHRTAVVAPSAVIHPEAQEFRGALHRFRLHFYRRRCVFRFHHPAESR